MSLIGIDPTIALALAAQRQAQVRASFPRKPARRLPAPVRRTVQPGITATPRVPEPTPRVPEPTPRIPAPRTEPLVTEPQHTEPGSVTRPAA